MDSYVGLFQQLIMKILHLSDTHGRHGSLKDLPEADVLVHSGDFCKICLCMVLMLFAFMPITSFGGQQPTKDIQTSPLWIVDGYALRDSIFRYSIHEMQSDSAAMLVERSLSFVSTSDIKSISCIDDTFQTVNIAIDKNIPVFVVLNGEEYKSGLTVPVGKVLTGSDWIQETIKSEFPYLDEYGIERAFVLREDGKQLFCYPPKGIVLIITTSKPYNKTGAMLDHMMPNFNIKPHKDKGGKP